MSEKNHQNGRRDNYRRFIFITAVCFVAGIWLLSFPIFNFPWKDTDAARLTMDAISLVAGAIMIGLAFTFWRIGFS